jgi:heme exporter protein B
LALLVAGWTALPGHPLAWTAAALASLAVPILIFGARATQLAISGGDIGPPMYLLGAIAMLGVTLAPLAAAAAVRIGLE